MSAAPVEGNGWSRGRWVVIIGLILAGQAGMIFWLAGHGTSLPPKVVTLPAPKVILPTAANSEVLEVNDPTSLVRANQRGYSGPAWMQTPTLTYEQPKWTDSAPPSNQLRVAELGDKLHQFLQTNVDNSIKPAPAPDADIPIIAPDDALANAHSTVSIEGELAKRQLRRTMKLDAWPGTEIAEILSNSVVQAGVDADGNVFSAILLNASGSKDADASALALTRAARFAPIRKLSAADADAKTWGQLVFRWHTLPLVVTNVSTSTP